MSDFDLSPDDANGEEAPSKTAIKREMAELQQLGTRIVELSEKYISRIPIEGRLQEAILQARGMKHREGRRRQLQYIGKLMRQAENIEAIREAYEKVVAIGQQNNRYLHTAEKWRDRMLGSEDDAVQEFIQDYPQTDIQHLRQLVRNARRELSGNKPPATSRKLFRYLRELIETDH